VNVQVTGEAQGDQSSLDKFIQHLRIGPSAAKVSGVEQKEVSVKEGESGFSQ
jgi:acylphosphatase